MLFRTVLSIVSMLFLLVDSSESRPAEQKPQTVHSVNLERYTGKWYEIARYPNRFQKKCAAAVTASYTMRADGKVDVLNQCIEADGKLRIAKGKAKVVDPSTNAKLKVTFFWPFSGDYWILELDPDYQYAVVGEPNRKYLWILSRTPQIDHEVYSKILDRIKAQGYDTTKLILTKPRLDGNG
jgi:apolipoprotein D and lipocalin family protein